MKIKKAAALLLSLFMIGSTVNMSYSVSAEVSDAVTADHYNKEYQLALEEIKKGLDNCEPEIKITARIHKNEIYSIFEKLINTDKNYFYVKTHLGYSFVNGYVRSLKFTYLIPKEEIEEAREKFNKRFDEFVNCVDDSMTDFQKCMAVHDKLALECEYDSEINPISYTSYAALVEGEAVCQGYSMAYAQILTALGIEADVMSSESMGHMWNMVKLNEKWYHVDVTYDDPLPEIKGKVRHINFMNSSEKMAEIDYTFDDSEIPHTADSVIYDKAFWKEIDNRIVHRGTEMFFAHEGHIRSYNTVSKKGKTLHTIDDVWEIYGTNAFYEGVYPGVELYGNKLYFNSSDTVYSYDLETDEISEIKTVSTKKGNLYGLYIMNGKLYAISKTTPATSDSGKWRSIAEITELI